MATDEQDPMAHAIEAAVNVIAVAKAGSDRNMLIDSVWVEALARALLPLVDTETAYAMGKNIGEVIYQTRSDPKGP